MSWCYFQESPEAFKQANNLFGEFLVRATPAVIRLRKACMSRGAKPVWCWLIWVHTNSTGFNSGAQVGKRYTCKRGCFSINSCVCEERWILWLSQIIIRCPCFNFSSCFKNSIVWPERRLHRKERTLNRIFLNAGLTRRAPNRFKRSWWFKLVRAVGVCPRGDQLRLSGDTKQKPLSSINTSTAFNVRHFFLSLAKRDASNSQSLRPFVG